VVAATLPSHLMPLSLSRVSHHSQLSLKKKRKRGGGGLARYVGSVRMYCTALRLAFHVGRDSCSYYRAA
jgi:hypothetical protein